MGKQAAASPGADWVIDTRSFAENRGIVEGFLTPEQLPRLADESLEDFAPIAVRIEGVRSPRGHAGLSVRLDGNVGLTCQRCMDPVDVTLSPHVKFELVDSLAVLEGDDDDEWDLLAHSDNLDLLVLLEDELLLAIPYAPMHASCAMVADGAAGAKVMPFAELARLKIRGSRRG